MEFENPVAVADCLKTSVTVGISIRVLGLGQEIGK